MTTNTILKIVAICVICTSTLMAGCLEVDDPVEVTNNANTNPNEEERFMEICNDKGIIPASSEIAYTPTSTTTQTPKHVSHKSIVDKYMNSVRSKYDKAKFDKSYMRDSDGFELYYSVRPNEAYHSYFYGGDGRWQVNTFSTYQPYDDMIEDENHGLSVYIDHYDTIRDAHDRMAKGSNTTFSCPDDHFITLEKLDYDQAYRYISPMHDDSNDVISGYSANVFIRNGKTIGRLHVYRYTDMDECAEVIDHYTPILASMLGNIE